MTKPVDREALEAALLEAIDSRWPRDSEDIDEERVRSIFGLNPVNVIRQEVYDAMMDALIDAATAYFFDEHAATVEEEIQEFLRKKIMDFATIVKREEAVSVKLSARKGGYDGDYTYTALARIGYCSTVKSPNIGSAITEALRRGNYDTINEPMVLIEPPKEEPVEQVAGDGTVITDEDVEAATGADPDNSIPF